MRIPDFLNDNGSIGFVAPSFGCNISPYRESFDNAQKKFEDMGYSLILGENCYEGCGVGISNTPEKCGEEINRFLGNPVSDVVISCGGGELMCEILEYVDFEKIASAKPVWYMGYSDNTNLTFLLPTLCDTAAIYAPCAPAFGMEPWHDAVRDAYMLLSGKLDSVSGYELWEKDSLKDEEHPLEPYNVTEPRIIRKFYTSDDKISMEGRLIGGCLDCLTNLTGTQFDRVKEFNSKYKDDGIIWFMESCDLNPMAIRRAVWQLKNAGWFQYVKGFLIGRPLCFGDELMGLNHYDAFLEPLKEFNVPVIMDLDIGHLSPMMPIVSGGMAKVEVESNDIQIAYLWR